MCVWRNIMCLKSIVYVWKNIARVGRNIACVRENITSVWRNIARVLNIHHLCSTKNRACSKNIVCLMKIKEILCMLKKTSTSHVFKETYILLKKHHNTSWKSEFLCHLTQFWKPIVIDLYTQFKILWHILEMISFLVSRKPHISTQKRNKNDKYFEQFLRITQYVQ